MKIYNNLENSQYNEYSPQAVWNMDIYIYFSKNQIAIICDYVTAANRSASVCKGIDIQSLTPKPCVNHTVKSELDSQKKHYHASLWTQIHVFLLWLQ